MRARTAVVWFSSPIYVNGRGRGKEPRTRLDLTVKTRMDSAATPGLRWVNDCAEFQLTDGSLCVIPRDRIAWIELGPEMER